MVDAVIVSTARTPIGKAVRGAFNLTHGADMGGHVVAHAVKRAGIEPGDVEDVTMGCANPEGATGGNIARQCAIRAGLPVTAAAQTINRFCSSGLQAIALAARSIAQDGVPVAVINTPFIQRMGLKAGPIAKWMLRGRRRKRLMRSIYAIKSL